MCRAKVVVLLEMLHREKVLMPPKSFEARLEALNPEQRMTRMTITSTVRARPLARSPCALARRVRSLAMRPSLAAAVIFSIPRTDSARYQHVIQ